MFKIFEEKACKGWEVQNIEKRMIAAELKNNQKSE